MTLTSPVIAEHVNELIAVAKTRPLIWREICVVLAYLAAHLIFLNGQRPGVVQRMTINEWEMRVVEDDHWVINVMDHQISGAFGPAHVAVSNEIVALMEKYYTNMKLLL